MTTNVFWVHFIDGYRTVYCSNKLNISLKNVCFKVLFLCWGTFAEDVLPIFHRKSWSCLQYPLNCLFRLFQFWDMKGNLFDVAFIEQFVYGGSSLFYIWYIYVSKFCFCVEEHLQRMFHQYFIERVEVVCNILLIVYFVSFNHEIWRGIFLMLHLLSNSFMVVQVCFIFDIYIC